jgi:FixJ family two-component response regulator
MLSVISVIDDDASVRAATENFLSSHGYIVDTFASAEDFLRSGRLEDTSCIVADVQMPGMSGLDLLSHLRGQRYNIPFIFITALPEEARAVGAGAIASLAKPFLASSLIEYLEIALGRHGAGSQDG